MSTSSCSACTLYISSTPSMAGPSGRRGWPRLAWAPCSASVCISSSSRPFSRARPSPARLHRHLRRGRSDGRAGGGPPHHPVLRASVLRRPVRAAHLHGMRARRPGKHGGRLHRVVHHERDHRHRRRRHLHGDGIRHRLRRLHRHDVRAAGRHPREATVSGRLLAGAVLAFLLALPFVPMGGTRQYVLHVVIQIFLWSFIGQAWSLMGRFGLVSLGHGAFLGVGAYTTTLLWNFYSLTPWIGMLLAVAAAVGIAVVLGIPS